MGYDGNKDGARLKQIDTDASVRALIRSRILDCKNNGSYNILTGESRPIVDVPAH